MKYDEFINNWLGKSIDWDLAVDTESTPFREVKSCVGRSIMKFKVLNTIIGFVTVNMMDNLARLKFSSKVLFHDKPMFQHIIRRNLDVSLMDNTSTLPLIMIGSSHKSPLTGIGTELSVSRFIIGKLLATFHALKTSLSGFVIADTPTKSSSLGRGSFKFGSTKFANMFHKLSIHDTVYGGQ